MQKSVPKFGENVRLLYKVPKLMERLDAEGVRGKYLPLSFTVTARKSSDVFVRRRRPQEPERGYLQAPDGYYFVTAVVRFRSAQPTMYRTGGFVLMPRDKVTGDVDSCCGTGVRRDRPSSVAYCPRVHLQYL